MLRKQLRNTENLDWMVEFSRQFAPLTLHLVKIWSFYETLETPLRVRIKPDKSPTMTETTLWTQVGGQSDSCMNLQPCASTDTIQIVDKRSATLADEYYYVGCEEVIPIGSTHAGLPTFDNGKDKCRLDEYRDSLEKVMKVADFENRGYDILARTIHVECHQFHQSLANVSRNSVKILSASPNSTLSQVFQQGPGHFVELRRTKALAPLTDASNELNSQPYANAKIPSPTQQSDVQRPMSPSNATASDSPCTECGEEESTRTTIQEDFLASSSNGKVGLETVAETEGSEGLLNFYRVPGHDQYRKSAEKNRNGDCRLFLAGNSRRCRYGKGRSHCPYAGRKRVEHGAL